ncbi:MAG: chemoreceptor glutamine deamidase CheD [Gammaproteobacteria bacterium]
MKALGTEQTGAARPLPGFEHINRYFDAQRKRYAAKILPGEYYVTRAEELIVTVLGSCVSACIWDPTARVGGMNHFMLPESGEKFSTSSISAASEAARYGSYAMEHLINAILKNGGRRERLLIKVVGGGRVLAGSTDVGAKNIAFVREFIRNEGMNLVGEHVGGQWPRKVCFDPMSGKAQVKELVTVANTTISERERAYQKSLVQAAPGGEVELF